MPDGPIPAATNGRTIWLRVGQLLDGRSLRPVRDAHVVYDADAILYVGPADRPPPADVRGAGRTTPDAVLGDYTLLPGLIESHAHLFLAGGELDWGARAAAARRSSGACLDAARGRLARLARLGVVAVRDAGDRLGIGLALSRLSRGSGRPLMPDVESPGAAIHHRGRYGAFMAEPLEDHPSPRACVQARVRDGADRIKLVATGVVDFERGGMRNAPQMTAEEVAALVEAAGELDRPTFAHASGAEGIRRVVDGGIGSVEHGFFMGAEELARMRDRAIAWTPTFAPVRAQLTHADRLGVSDRARANLHRILDGHAALLRRAHEMGVAITAGSDAGAPGVPHGYGLLDELELMEAAGLPPAAALMAASGTPASSHGLRRPCGRVEPGYPSRFIVARHSPLERIANLRRARHVVFDGIVYDSPEGGDTASL